MELLNITPDNIAALQKRILGEQNGFVLCQQGEVRLTVDERKILIPTSHLCILPPYVELQQAACSPDARALFGMSDSDFVLTALNSATDSRSIIEIGVQPLAAVDAQQMGRIEEVFELLQRRRRLSTPFSPQIVASLVETLCFELLDAYNADFQRSPAGHGRKFTVFCNFITSLHANFHEHRDVAFYAGQQCLTPRYFATLIRELSGRSPSDLIAQFVTLEARKLLSDSSLPVKEIAVRLHFPSQSFFGRYFRHHVGCTPLEYRSPAAGGKQNVGESEVSLTH